MAGRCLKQSRNTWRRVELALPACLDEYQQQAQWHYWRQRLQNSTAARQRWSQTAGFHRFTLSLSLSHSACLFAPGKKFLDFNNTLITLCSDFWLKVSARATKKGCLLGKFFHRSFPSGVKRHLTEQICRQDSALTFH